MTTREWHTGAIFSPSGDLISKGEVVFITKAWPVKRRWWQFWRPLWTEGPIETRRYIAGDYETAIWPTLDTQSGTKER